MSYPLLITGALCYLIKYGLRYFSDFIVWITYESCENRDWFIWSWKRLEVYISSMFPGDGDTDDLDNPFVAGL